MQLHFWSNRKPTLVHCLFICGILAYTDRFRVSYLRYHSIQTNILLPYDILLRIDIVTATNIYKYIASLYPFDKRFPLSKLYPTTITNRCALGYVRDALLCVYKLLEIRSNGTKTCCIDFYFHHVHSIPLWFLLLHNPKMHKYCDVRRKKNILIYMNTQNHVSNVLFLCKKNAAAATTTTN